jgi:geranylgeranyl diphosphate synthase type II
MEFDVAAYLKRCGEAVDGFADRAIPPENRMPGVLYAAMRYSFFSGGKRFRPALGFAAAEAVSGRGEDALPFVTAIEMIHTYSLIHDDLPALDDDDLRRGRATSHVAFGEAMAILAGDALATDAFRLFTLPEVIRSYPAQTILACLSEIAQAAGSGGMVAGQVLDILSEGKTLDMPTLEFLHTRKTGALIRAAVRCGGIAAGADEERMLPLGRYADRLGLAFQVADDILDVVGDTAVLGKPVGSDEGKRKATYPALLGVEEARRRLWCLLDEAQAAVEPFGERGEPLRALARFVGNREH